MQQRVRRRGRRSMRGTQRGHEATWNRLPRVVSDDSLHARDARAGRPIGTACSAGWRRIPRMQLAPTFVPRSSDPLAWFLVERRGPDTAHGRYDLKTLEMWNDGSGAAILSE